MLTEKLELESDESILVMVRKHWFILAIELVGVATSAVIPFLIIPIAFPLLRNAGIPLTFDISASVLTALGSAWLLLMWMIFFNILTNYFLDTWTITNKRLIAIDQRGFFNRSVSSFRLERLQDLSVDIRGIIPTLLNFGTLHAQTAGADNKDFRATGLPNPRELKERMLTAAGARTESLPVQPGRMEI
jgi:hypothetical protein